MSSRILIGEGSFGWHRYERQSDRYGTVAVYPADTYFDRPKDIRDYFESDVGPLPIPTLHAERGRLVAEIVAVRQSSHIGDIFRGMFTSQPEAGETVVLSEVGTVVREQPFDGEDSEFIGIRPDDGREHDWLDPEALYRCHDQLVRLYLEPPEESDADADH